MNITELAVALDETPRQIRFLVAEGIIPKPTRGTLAQYGPEAVAAGRQYAQLKSQGYKLSKIKVLMSANADVDSTTIRLPIASGLTLEVDPSLLGNIDADGLAGRVLEIIKSLGQSDLRADLSVETATIMETSDAL